MTRQDGAAIRKVIAATTEMFNRRDAKGFVRHYTPDADLVTVRGEVMKGTAVALAFVTNELSGLVGPGGEHLPAHLERSVRVFVKKDGAWKVTAFHNTRLGERPPT